MVHQLEIENQVLQLKIKVINKVFLGRNYL
jgi:hypothetical protein